MRLPCVFTISRRPRGDSFVLPLPAQHLCTGPLQEWRLQKVEKNFEIMWAILWRQNELSEPEKCVLDEDSNTTGTEMNGKEIHSIYSGLPPKWEN